MLLVGRLEEHPACKNWAMWCCCCRVGAGVLWFTWVYAVQIHTEQTQVDWQPTDPLCCPLNAANIISCVPEKSTFLFFEWLCQKLTDFNNFWHVKLWENLTWTPYRFVHPDINNHANNHDSAVQCHLTARLFCEGGGVRFIPAFVHFCIA